MVVLVMGWLVVVCGAIAYASSDAVEGALKLPVFGAVFGSMLGAISVWFGAFPEVTFWWPYHDHRLRRGLTLLVAAGFGVLLGAALGGLLGWLIGGTVGTLKGPVWGVVFGSVLGAIFVWLVLLVDSASRDWDWWRTREDCLGLLGATIIAAAGGAVAGALVGALGWLVGTEWGGLPVIALVGVGFGIMYGAFVGKKYGGWPDAFHGGMLALIYSPLLLIAAVFLLQWAAGADGLVVASPGDLVIDESLGLVIGGSLFRGCVLVFLAACGGGLCGAAAGSALGWIVGAREPASAWAALGPLPPDAYRHTIKSARKQYLGE
jgi:hypothetical protein